jgi:hypothetical protein
MNNIQESRKVHTEEGEGEEEEVRLNTQARQLEAGSTQRCLDLLSQHFLESNPYIHT